MKKLFINGIICSILAFNIIGGGLEVSATEKVNFLNSVNQEENLKVSNEQIK